MMKVLLVDDEPGLLELSEIYLEKDKDVEVETASSARDALDLLKDGDYDAIVSDYQMPETDGIEFLKAVRSQGNVIPFVLFTGKGREEVVIEALNSGADFYVKKGGDPRSQFAELANMVRQAVARRQAEETLRKSEERYRTTLDNMLEGCQIIDRNWRYVYVNNAAARHGRRLKAELLGRTMMEVYPGIENTEMFIALRECMEQKVRCRMENEFKYPDGSVGWFELSMEPVSEGVFVLSIEISERKMAEEMLQESEKHFRSLIENASDVIAVVDNLGYIKFMSPAVGPMLGYDPAELVGKNLGEIVHPDDMEHSMTRIRRVAKGEVNRGWIELRLRRKDGSWCPIEAVGSASGDAVADRRDVVINARDITERKNATLRLEHLNKVLRAIHNVNVLIIRERDRDRLLQGVVDTLVEKRGFYAAWILLFDDSGRPSKTFGAGLGERTQILASLPKRGLVPGCIPKAMDGEDIVIGNADDSICRDCLMAMPNPGRAIITARLSHRGRLFGLMHVSLPAVVADLEDKMLMEELAGDVAYALHNIATEEAMPDGVRPSFASDSRMSRA